jgi:hypothetical protein
MEKLVMVFAPVKIGMALLTSHDKPERKPGESAKKCNRIFNDYARA